MSNLGAIRSSSLTKGASAPAPLVLPAAWGAAAPACPLYRRHWGRAAGGRFGLDHRPARPLVAQRVHALTNMAQGVGREPIDDDGEEGRCREQKLCTESLSPVLFLLAGGRVGPHCTKAAACQSLLRRLYSGAVRWSACPPSSEPRFCRLLSLPTSISSFNSARAPLITVTGQLPNSRSHVDHHANAQEPAKGRPQGMSFANSCACVDVY